jgi:hypothetical protein
MAFIATKPCRFAGQSFKVGEIIPADVLQPGASKNLVKMGIIAEEGGNTLIESKITVTEEVATRPEINVVIHGKEGDMNLKPTQEGLQAIFDVLTDNVSGAEQTINKITDDDALILLHIADSRKSIKELAETRAKALNAPQEGEESEGEE